MNGLKAQLIGGVIFAWMVAIAFFLPWQDYGLTVKAFSLVVAARPLAIFVGAFMTVFATAGWIAINHAEKSSVKREKQ